MVSDSELIGRLREFLRNSDLNTTTTGIVRRKLEEDFGVDLSDKKLFIREQVDLFLQTEHARAEVDGGDGDENVKVEADEHSGDGGEDDDDDEEETGIEKGQTGSNKEVKKRGGGFSKLCRLSPQLQEFIGVPEMARTEVVKQLWIHIKEKSLQDPSNRRNIICDEPLKALFSVNSINMFQMNKALSKHIWPLDSNDVIPAISTPKEKQQKEKPQKEKLQKKRPKQEKEEDSEDDSGREEKRQKKGKSGFLAPLQLSDALVTFLGTGECALSRADVVKRMWQYIKQNNLQDPSDKRRIICDEKLKELFDVETFNGFTVSKLLATHFVKSKQ